MSDSIAIKDRCVERVSSESPHLLYLDTRWVSPGDVLLTLSADKMGNVLATEGVGSKKYFSHAALIQSPVSLIQSTPDDGVHRQTLFLDRIDQSPQGGQRRELACLGEKVCAAVLLRHPKFADRFEYGNPTGWSEAELDALSQACAQYLGLDYARFENLLHAWRAKNPTIKALVRPLARLAQGAKGLSPEFEGPFCSTLVAGAFHELGVKLYAEPRSLDSISPNLLFEAQLDAVPEAIVPLDPNETADRAEASLINQSLGYHAQLELSVELIAKQNHVIQRLIEEFRG